MQLDGDVGTMVMMIPLCLWNACMRRHVFQYTASLHMLEILLLSPEEHSFGQRGLLGHRAVMIMMVMPARGCKA